MSKSSTLLIEHENLSVAWAKAFQAVACHKGQEIAPLIVTITGFEKGEAQQNPLIRKELDKTLQKQRKFSCETVANTLFPYSLWNPALGSGQLFQRYLDILPSLRKLDSHNKYGLYFERLIAYGNEKFNQLDHIIRTYRMGNHRRSALQASIFLPLVDHTHQRQRGFPCMQQVMFTPKDGELAVTGVYATQYLFERAYGNYLGLSHLGQFIAYELNLKLTRVSCIAGIAQLGAIKKKDVQDLLCTIENYLPITRSVE